MLRQIHSSFALLASLFPPHSLSQPLTTLPSLSGSLPSSLSASKPQPGSSSNFLKKDKGCHSPQSLTRIHPPVILQSPCNPSKEPLPMQLINFWGAHMWIYTPCCKKTNKKKNPKNGHDRMARALLPGSAAGTQ